MQREPVVAGMFYPANPERARAEVAEMLQAAQASLPAGRFVAGLVPHAGWAYSGPTAARAFAALAAGGAPQTVVFFGAVHAWGVRRPALYARGAWHTPLGPLPVDEAMAAEILREAGGEVAASEQAHSEEHSIEVQLPFVAYLWPKAAIVPLMVPPSAGAAAVGEAVARAVQPRGHAVYLVGSSDLTHYGPNYGIVPRGAGPEALAWAKENDQRLLDDVVHLRAEAIVERANADRSACGGGAIAATVAAARALGATEGRILEHTTSYDVRPTGTPRDFVGYASVVFS
ncbi:MAG TPA: AmmeMemoRadiSam system protein B [Anaerolineae bacterium]|nr:AmmeMemoRadiSam system protein B [Anaerolineae bacterium]HOQ99656.1 AmmeMemoRadiSam system protein B [Anaerolineae bacterium]HPL26758.1 AmmeMemoRadiSam system protein B [Anaerolineae bacterium]